MNCKIKISSSGNGWKDNRSCDGTYHLGEGMFSLEYTLDGDKCRFVCTPDEAFQTRSGSVTINISFLKGRQTECVLLSSQGTGGYRVYTKQLTYRAEENGAVAELVYLSGEDKEKIKLRIEAAVRS
jgi:hypothetical protein